MHTIRTRIVIATVGLLWAAMGCQKPPTTAPVAPTTTAAQPRLPLPENRTIDSIGYGYSIPGPGSREESSFLDPSEGITITREGKVSFHYESAPATGSGGYVVNKDWQIPAQEAEALLDGLVTDGLLELETILRGRRGFAMHYRGWEKQIIVRSLPERMLARLQPYIEKGEEGHPRIRSHQTVTTAPSTSTVPATSTSAVKETRGPLPGDGTLDSFEWGFLEAALESPQVAQLGTNGPRINLSITREGKVHYYYQSKPGTGSGGHVIGKDWDIPPQEAKELLDGLVADGLLDLKSTGGNVHGIQLGYRGWKKYIAPASLPQQIIARLRPYLEKGKG